MVFIASTGTANPAFKRFASREVPPLGRQRRAQHHAVRPARANGDGQCLARRRHMEVIAQPHRHERADEERFRAGLPHRAAFVGDRKHIAVPLAERVVHLVDQRRERAVGVAAEIDADRIEVVAERARHAEKPDRPAAGVDPLRFEKPIRLRAQGRARRRRRDRGRTGKRDCAGCARTLSAAGRGRGVRRDRSGARTGGSETGAAWAPAADGRPSRHRDWTSGSRGPLQDCRRLPRREPDARGFAGDAPRALHAAELLGDGQSRLQRVLVEARAEMRAADTRRCARPAAARASSGRRSPPRRTADDHRRSFRSRARRAADATGSG